jgi:hypothetical protein
MLSLKKNWNTTIQLVKRPLLFCLHELNYMEAHLIIWWVILWGKKRMHLTISEWSPELLISWHFTGLEWCWRLNVDFAKKLSRFSLSIPISSMSIIVTCTKVKLLVFTMPWKKH